MRGRRKKPTRNEKPKSKVKDFAKVSMKQNKEKKWSKCLQRGKQKTEKSNENNLLCARNRESWETRIKSSAIYGTQKKKKKANKFYDDWQCVIYSSKWLSREKLLKLALRPCSNEKKITLTSFVESFVIYRIVSFRFFPSIWPICLSFSFMRFVSFCYIFSV